MKKSLLAVAVLGAFAGSALAADVTLYGIVDEGLVFSHVDSSTQSAALKKDDDGLTTNTVVWTKAKKTNKFSLDSGVQSGSRWGLKGSEELGSGYKVGFVLESGFNADTGKGNTQLFNRESVLYVDGPFGRVYAGRQGSMNQGTGSVGLVGKVTAFGTSFGNYVTNAGAVFSTDTVRDNTLTYVTPKFAGFQGYLQYSMGTDGSENKSNGNDRYAAIAATYDNGPLALYFGADRIFYGHDAGADVDDSLTVTLGGSYDFGVLKTFAGVQYFDEVKASSVKGMFSNTFSATAKEVEDADLDEDPYTLSSVTFDGDTKIKGYGVNLSVSAPLFGGTGMAGAAYMDASEADSVKGATFDYERARVTVGYLYSFSKRTNLYAIAGYGKDKIKSNAGESVKPDYAIAGVGLRHRF